MTRPSRPDFDMTYRLRSASFRLRWTAWIPAAIHLVMAVVTVGLVVWGYQSQPGSPLFRLVVEQANTRLISAKTLAIIVSISAVASLLRTEMRGVQVSPQGILYRDVEAFALPKARRIRWPQIDLLFFSKHGVRLMLWDGRYVDLPEVSDRVGLARALELEGTRRGIPIQGGEGLDEAPEALDELEAAS